jgi:hypothetical protein
MTSGPIDWARSLLRRTRFQLRPGFQTAEDRTKRIAARYMQSVQKVDQPQRPSLPDVFSSVRVSQSPNLWWRALGFLGPGFLICVGYMDPGNWATGLAGGSRYG